MAEPSSTAGIAGIAAGALAIPGVAAIPGIDAVAVIGAFAGALFFVVFDRAPTFKASLGYLVSSWVFGYMAAAEAAAREVPITPGLSALIAAALFVTIASGVLNWAKGGKAPFWFRYIPWLGGKKDG